MVETRERKRRRHSGKRPTLTIRITKPNSDLPTFTTTLIERAINAAENTESIPILSNPATNHHPITPVDSRPARDSDPVFEIIRDSGRLMELVDRLAEMQTDLGEHLGSIDEGRLAGEAHYLDTAVWALEKLVASREEGCGVVVVVMVGIKLVGWLFAIICDLCI
ncbi:unnamed protein product [Tuber aestivum]|uniref:Uncharacterized protein n=1 Tax=Tuber aestivum TaxID=59557 RepID=A0A292PR44_9PEZI|nr:unnamed protein product [Tuber aestivum]